MPNPVIIESIYTGKNKSSRYGATGESSSKDSEGDEGTGATFKKGKAESAGTVQPGEKLNVYKHLKYSKKYCSYSIHVDIIIMKLKFKGKFNFFHHINY